MKEALQRLFDAFGYEVRRRPSDAASTAHRLANGAPIPDSGLYRPLYRPWEAPGTFATYRALAERYSVVSPDRLWVLYSIARQALRTPGAFVECGVYRGGTAAMLAALLAESPNRDEPKKLHLFDTFNGMPEPDPTRDWHRQGDFGDTSLATVRSVVGHDSLVVYHVGRIPETFRGWGEMPIALAHVDVDLYDSVAACCEFVTPRLARGGFIVFDDYGFPTCPGARSAVDRYYRGTPYVPLVLPTGQAIVFASFGNEPSAVGQART